MKKLLNTGGYSSFMELPSMSAMVSATVAGSFARATAAAQTPLWMTAWWEKAPLTQVDLQG